MKIERPNPIFTPVVIKLETPEELQDFKDMVKYAFNQCDTHSDLDRVARAYFNATKDLS